MANPLSPYPPCRRSLTSEPPRGELGSRDACATGRGSERRGAEGRVCGRGVEPSVAGRCRGARRRGGRASLSLRLEEKSLRLEEKKAKILVWRLRAAKVPAAGPTTFFARMEETLPRDDPGAPSTDARPLRHRLGERVGRLRRRDQSRHATGGRSVSTSILAGGGTGSVVATLSHFDPNGPRAQRERSPQSPERAGSANPFSGPRVATLRPSTIMRRQPTGYLVQPQRTPQRAVDEGLLEWLMQPHAEHIPVTLEDVLRRPQWHRQAACRGMGTSGFVKSTGGAYGVTRRECARCPVRQECLDFALADESIVGLWGGTSDAERRELRRRAVA